MSEHIEALVAALQKREHHFRNAVEGEYDANILMKARFTLEAMQRGLKPFADCCDQIAADESSEEWAKFRLLIGDYRRAKAAFDGLYDDV